MISCDRYPLLKSYIYCVVMVSLLSGMPDDKHTTVRTILMTELFLKQGRTHFSQTFKQNINKYTFIL